MTIKYWPVLLLMQQPCVQRAEGGGTFLLKVWAISWWFHMSQKTGQLKEIQHVTFEILNLRQMFSIMFGFRWQCSSVNACQLFGKILATCLEKYFANIHENMLHTQIFAECFPNICQMKYLPNVCQPPEIFTKCLNQMFVQFY